jgi:hypothetical protein
MSAGCFSSNAMSASPIASVPRSPSSSGPSTVRPSSSVPLALPRSSTSGSPSSGQRRRAWKRDTFGWSMTTSFDACRPMRMQPPFVRRTGSASPPARIEY